MQHEPIVIQSLPSTNLPSLFGSISLDSAGLEEIKAMDNPILQVEELMIRTLLSFIDTSILTDVEVEAIHGNLEHSLHPLLLAIVPFLPLFFLRVCMCGVVRHTHRHANIKGRKGTDHGVVEYPVPSTCLPD